PPDRSAQIAAAAPAVKADQPPRGGSVLGSPEGESASPPQSATPWRTAQCGASPCPCWPLRLRRGPVRQSATPPGGRQRAPADTTRRQGNGPAWAAGPGPATMDRPTRTGRRNLEGRPHARNRRL